MALVNDAKKEINAKIVYIGPTGSGKSTTLRYIYSTLKPDLRSQLKTLPAGDQQMLFFDFIQPVPLCSDAYRIRFHVYTMVGSGIPQSSWNMLLKGADGVVFLVDSASERRADNLETATSLKRALAAYGIKASDVPLSLQCNKRDLLTALSPELLKKELFPGYAGPALPVTSATGDGLLDGLNRLINTILENLGQKVSPPTDEIGETLLPEASVGERSVLSAVNAAVRDASPHLTLESAGEAIRLDEKSISIPVKIVNTIGEQRSEIVVKLTVTL